MSINWKPLPKRTGHLSEEEIVYRQYLFEPEVDGGSLGVVVSPTEEQKKNQSESFEKLLKRLMLDVKTAARERRANAKENKANGWPKAFW